jgi:hypothetical protein
VKDIYAGPVRASEVVQLDTQLRSTPENLFDPDLLTYTSSLRFIAARENARPLVFMPIQTVYMLESLAVSPDASELEIAKSLGVLMQSVVYEAQTNKVNEVYFICRDANVIRFAEKHGYEAVMKDPELKVTLFRIKVGKL